MLLPILILLIAIVAIYFGAQWLVEGASELAAYLGVPPLVIGLTIVAFGTSLPELVLGVMSGLEGVSSLSVGNVIGANISNATYIIGACAILTPIVVRFEQIRREAIFMLVALFVLFLFAYDGVINALDGIIMIALFVLYLTLLVRSLYCCRPSRAVVEEFEAARPETEPPLKSLSFVLVGAVMLIVATDAAVRSATEVATILGMSEFLIGITIVTFGTTTPEFATSMLAAYKKRPDIAVGNTLGTLVFNSVFVLGIGAVIRPLTMTDSQILLGILPLLLSGILLAGIVYRREGIGRWEGVALVALYIVYMAVLLSYS
ncbi:MAG: putative membrane protein [Methanomassiliicoccales archaeon PtaB.Bin134]|nr:MAG: putative membrane protein [Methanomassiliicoccales archaeon PtaB.Bin134]